MTTLKDINFGINQYCGPAVLSALTGESTDRCAAVISAVSGRKEIKAVQQEHLVEALKRLRFDIIETNFAGSTLYGTLYRMHNHNGLYIIFVPNHVIAIEVQQNDIFICDNHTKTPLDIKQSARLTQTVLKVLKVIPRNPPKLIRDYIRLSKTPHRIDIYTTSEYENPEDNIEYSLGYIRFKDDEELRQITEALWASLNQ